jgi:SpoVK/Ycf46/Vps4 family AAA+-type ATPase
MESEVETGLPAEATEAASEAAHSHVCAACGMPYGHAPWQCEPPDDQYCPMCSENVAGPMPVWIERWIGDGNTEPAAQEPADPKQTAVSAAPNTATAVKAMDNSGGAAAAKMAPVGSSTPADAKEASAEKPVPSTASVESLESDNSIPNPTKHGLAKVGGMDELKAMLYEDVVTAMRDPQDLKAYGLTIPNGILLFGPPGCGKTFISRALAEEMDFYFAEVFPSEIGSTFIHGTTLKIRELFDTAADRAPSIVFVDEFEGMVPARRELAAHQHQTAEEVSEFLKQLETCAERQILLIAATNEPWKIDPAVQRTGRLDKRIYVGPPDAAARAAILRFHLYGRRVGAIDVEGLAKSLDGYSAADLKVLVDEAARLARKARAPIAEDDLRKAARERVPPSISAQEEQRFQAFEQRGTGSGPRRASQLLLPDDASPRTARRAPSAAELLADLLRKKS